MDSGHLKKWHQELEEELATREKERDSAQELLNQRDDIVELVEEKLKVVERLILKRRRKDCHKE